MRWDALQLGVHRLRLRVGVEVVFKRITPFASRIQDGALKETTHMANEWLLAVEQELNVPPERRRKQPPPPPVDPLAGTFGR